MAASTEQPGNTQHAQAETGGRAINVGAHGSYIEYHHHYAAEATEAVYAIPFMAPDLPLGFVPRPVEFAALRRALIEDRGEAVATTTALHGAGGCGKTSLAIALAQDGDIRDAYPDGVLWTTLGETPGDVTGRLNTLTRSLRPNVVPETDLALATARLREALEGKRCLVVIDDAWRRRDLAPFLEGGSDSARLITTRDEEVLPVDAARPRIVPVDAMRVDQAATMLRRGFAKENVAPLAARLRRLAANLGEWPLLLELAHARMARRVRAGHSLADTLSVAEAAWARKGVGAFDARNEAGRNEAAAASLELSIEALVESEGPHAAQRLEEISVFAEDQDVPYWLVAALWNRTGRLDQLDADDLLLRLRSLSFLERYDADRQVFRLHDVIRRHLRARAREARMAECSREVAYAITECATDGWTELVAEPYALAHLPQHFAEAGAEHDLEALLCDAAWMEARLAAGIAAGEGAAALVATYRAYANGAVSQAVGVVFSTTGRDLAIHGPANIIPQLLGGVPEGPDYDEKRDRWRASVRSACLLPIRPSFVPPTGELFRTHLEGQPWTVAISPDGATLGVTLGDTDGAQFWDVATGAERGRIDNHYWMSSVAFSPCGKQVATGVSTGIVRVSDVDTLVEIFEFRNVGPVKTLAFSPDSKCLAITNFNGVISIWDLAAGILISNIEIRYRDCAAFSSDGTLIVTGGSDNVLRLWDIYSGAMVAELKGNTDGIQSIAFSADGDLLATGGSDSAVRLWNVEKGLQIGCLEGHEFAVVGLAFSRYGDQLTTVERGGVVRRWNLATKTESMRVEGIDSSACVALSPDGERIAAGGMLGVVSCYDITKFELQTRLEVSASWSARVALSPDCREIATAGNGCSVRLWDIASGAETAQLEASGHVSSLAYSPDGRWIATGAGIAQVWDHSTGLEVARFQGFEGNVRDVAFSPDGTTLAASVEDATVRLWNLASETQIAKLTGHGGWVESVAFSPDGKQLATAGQDLIARVWDMPGGVESSCLSGHQGMIFAIRFSVDGALLATGSNDGSVRLWCASTGGEIGRLEGHIGWVRAVAFSPDGRWIATGGSDRSVRLWNLTEPQAFIKYMTQGAVTSIEFFSDSTRIAVASGSTVPHLFEIRE